MNHSVTHLLDLPRGSNNPRNSEGAFIRLKDGGLLFIYSRFTGDDDRDHVPADLAYILSYDQGDTWTEPAILFTAKEHDAWNIMSVSLIRMGNGDIGLFYLVRKSWYDMRPVLRRSSDEGKTWSEPVFCVQRPAYFVLNNDRVIRLKSGRILVAVAEHVTTPGTDGGAFTHPGVARTFFSDDDGLTWGEGRGPVAINVPISKRGMQEPGLIEHENGVVTMYLRTDMGRQYECHSLDGGYSWSAPTPSCFTAPDSPLCMKRLKDGRLIAVWNPIPRYQTRHIVSGGMGRTPLVYALSADDGQTWSEPVILEDDEDRGYCYTAIHEEDGKLFLAYGAGRPAEDGWCLTRLRIARLDVSTL